MNIVIVAGGTGGHLYPGVALARALIGHAVTFVVRRADLGREILAREGFSVKEVTGAGLPRRLSLSVLIFPFKFVLGILETAHFLLTHRPDVIVGMGGYLSVPVVVLGWLLGIRTLLHEQNVYPGLANRFLARYARSVAVSFKESERYFPRSKVWTSGLPIRPEIGQVDQTTGRRTFGLELETKTYLVFGGSLGAQRLNRTLPEVWKALIQKGERFQVLHITGKNDLARVESLYRDLPIKSTVSAYCHDMASAYAAADVVVCRSGASTICELLVAKRRALCVPYPYATNHHQLYNAQVAVKAGLALVLEEKELTVPLLIETLARLQTVGRVDVPDSSSGAAARLADHLTAQVR